MEEGDGEGDYEDTDMGHNGFFGYLKRKINQKKKKLRFTFTRNSKLKEIDKNMRDLFEIEDPGHGDEFMAVLPWKGAIKEPTNHPYINPQIPDVTYQIDFVYGYRTEDCRMNLFYNLQKKPVYMAASLGIIFNPRTRRQLYFGGGETCLMERKQLDESITGHTDDITALAMSKDRTLVVTG